MPAHTPNQRENSDAPRRRACRSTANARAHKLSMFGLDRSKVDQLVEAVFTKINNREENEEERRAQLTLAHEILSQLYLEEDEQLLFLSKKHFYKLLSEVIQIIHKANQRGHDDTHSLSEEIVQYIKSKSAFLSARRKAHSGEHGEISKAPLYEYVSNIIEHQEYLSNIQETSDEDLEEAHNESVELEDELELSQDKSNLLSELKINEHDLEDADIPDTYEYKTMSQLVEHMRAYLSTQRNPADPYRIFEGADNKLLNNFSRTINNYYNNILARLKNRKIDISKVPDSRVKYELLCNIISISSAYFDTVEDFMKMLQYRSTVYKYINLWAIIRYKIQSYCTYKAKQLANNSSDFILAEVVGTPHSERKKLKFLHFKIH